MRNRDAPTTIGPAAYDAWRASSVGEITDAIEQRLILRMMGTLTGARILDVGCGDGTLVCVAASRGAEVVGIDPDPAMLAAARQRMNRAGFQAIFADSQIAALPFPDASFDVVVSITALCFVDDVSGAIREMARVLRPGGRLVLGELGRWSIWAALRRVRGWLGSATWKAARFHSASELSTLVQQAGLSVTSLRGAVYYPPLSLLARGLAPIDPCLGRVTTFGAAFVALTGKR